MPILTAVSDSRVPPQPTRYDEAADLYLAEVGETLTDPGATALLELVSPLDGPRLPTSAPARAPGMLLSYRTRRPVMTVKKVAVTLPEELFDMVERARKIEHRTRSEVIQEALRTHFGEPVYVPTDEERRMLDRALVDLHEDPESGRSWNEVRNEIWPTA
jgi:hypothetical protein